MGFFPSRRLSLLNTTVFFSNVIKYLLNVCILFDCIKEDDTIVYLIE